MNDPTLCMHVVLNLIYSFPFDLQQESPTFRWTIEEISRINPADIDEFPVHQYTENVDPDVEHKAQEAINK